MIRQIVTIASFSISNLCFGQRTGTLFNKDFDHFRLLTDSLIAEINLTDVKGELDWPASLVSSKMAYYCDTIRRQLVRCNSHGAISFKLLDYFDKGKPARGQDFSSPVAQLQCSYYFFIEAFRKAGNINNEIKAALSLRNWLQNGFPETRYCPYVYAPVGVNFGKPKPVFVDTVPKNKTQN
jgi:hypothetical protein